MKKEFEAYYSKAYAYVFVVLILLLLFGIVMFSIFWLHSLSSSMISYSLCIISFVLLDPPPLMCILFLIVRFQFLTTNSHIVIFLILSILFCT